jgi:DNA polymerase elongation subunit (family B)
MSYILYPHDYIIKDINNHCTVIIVGRTENGTPKIVYYSKFCPTFKANGTIYSFTSIAERTKKYYQLSRGNVRTYNYFTPLEHQFFVSTGLIPHAPISISIDKSGEIVLAKTDSSVQKLIIRICMLDIETANFVSHAEYPIAGIDPIAICCNSYVDHNGKAQGAATHSFTLQSKDIIKDISGDIDNMCPDMFLTFNGNKYDWGFIHDNDINARFAPSKIPATIPQFTKNVNKNAFYSKAKYDFPGIINFDIYEFLYHFRKQFGLRKVSLKEVAKQYLGSDCQKIETDIPTMFKDIELMHTRGDYKDLGKYVEYCTRDTTLLYQLYIKLGLEDILLTMSREALLPVRVIINDLNLYILGRALLKFGDRVDDASLHAMRREQYMVSRGAKTNVDRAMIGAEYDFKKMFRGGNPYSRQDIDALGFNFQKKQYLIL